MAKKKKEIPSLLTKEQEKELQNMVNGMLDVAAELIEEYDDLELDELQELSGSITQIHETSPFLDEIFNGDSWKKVIKNIPTISKTQKVDKEDDSE